MNNRQTNNYAQHADLQAGIITDSTITIQAKQEESPQDKYASGVSRLNSGEPRLARELIAEAFHSGVDGSEVRFHWVLAMLSKRSFRDLSVDERAQLEKGWERLPRYAEDAWKQGLVAIREVLSCQQGPAGDDAWALELLRGVREEQRDMIVEHLNLVLTATMKEITWGRRRKLAKESQLSNDRLKSAWAYFQPEPIPARADQRADRAPSDDEFKVAIASVTFVMAVGCLSFLAVVNADLVTALAFLVAVVGGYVCSHHWLEWRFHMQRLRIKDEEYYGRPAGHVEGSGFTARVHRTFAYYFDRYPPKGIEREEWHGESEGIRDTLAHEISTIYRESRIPVRRITWLIRYLARDTAKRWYDGTLWDYQLRYRVRSSTRAWCLFGLIATIPAAGIIAVAAVQLAPAPAIIAIVAAVLCGPTAARHASTTKCNERHRVHDKQDRDRQLADRKVEYKRWKTKLDSLRPSDEQMETWLNSDKVVMLDEALKQYRLAWRDVIAHAFLQMPDRPCKSQRSHEGQWRYSKYNLRLFIITADGVREVSRRLDFERASLSGPERLNYRFEAVSSVEVSETERHSCTLELTLMNGSPRKIFVSASDSARPGLVDDPSVVGGQPGANGETIDVGGDAAALDDDVRGVDYPPGAENVPGAGDDESRADEYAQMLEVDLDASGFVPTLRILEGIAADGKNWVAKSLPQTPVTLPSTPLADQMSPGRTSIGS